MAREVLIRFEQDDMEPMLNEIRRSVRTYPTGTDCGNFWTWLMVQIIHEVDIGVPFGTDICNTVLADIEEVVEEALDGDPTSASQFDPLVKQITRILDKLMNLPGTINVWKHVKDVLEDYDFRNMHVVSASYERYLLEIELED